MAHRLLSIQAIEKGYQANETGSRHRLFNHLRYPSQNNRHKNGNSVKFIRMVEYK